MSSVELYSCTFEYVRRQYAACLIGKIAPHLELQEQFTVIEWKSYCKPGIKLGIRDDPVGIIDAFKLSFSKEKYCQLFVTHVTSVYAW